MKLMPDTQRYGMLVEVVEGLFDDMTHVLDKGPTAMRYPMYATASRNADGEVFGLTLLVDASGLPVDMRIGQEQSTDQKKRRKV
jgi:hypothetical protein